MTNKHKTPIDLNNATQQLLQKYESALENLSEPKLLLPLLLLRDEIEKVFKEINSPVLSQAERLVALDKLFKNKLNKISLDFLSEWRRTIQPPNNYWWWWFDIEREKNENLIWELVTSLLILFSTTVSAQVIRKLWDGAADNFSIFGTLLVIAITSSPFTSLGKEIANWVLKIVRVQKAMRAQAMATMALLAFLVILMTQFLVLPELASYYNRQGLTALKTNELTQAKQYFQRAIAINPDYVIGYYHIAKVYKDIGQYDEAIVWYEKSIEANLDFPLSYIDLANIKIEKGELDDAIKLLTIASQKVNLGLQDPDKDLVNYAIFINLGWAYYEKSDLDLAQEYLINAKSSELSISQEFRKAKLYYLLAKISETKNQTSLANTYWENMLKYLDQRDATQLGWKAEALKALNTLNK